MDLSSRYIIELISRRTNTRNVLLQNNLQPIEEFSFELRNRFLALLIMLRTGRLVIVWTPDSNKLFKGASEIVVLNYFRISFKLFTVTRNERAMYGIKFSQTFSL